MQEIEQLPMTQTHFITAQGIFLLPLGSQILFIVSQYIVFIPMHEDDRQTIYTISSSDFASRWQ